MKLSEHVLLQRCCITRPITTIVLMIALIWVIMVRIFPGINEISIFQEDIGSVVAEQIASASSSSSAKIGDATPSNIRKIPAAAAATTTTFSKKNLNMTICVDKCNDDCKTYITPIGECYNSNSLYPNDPAWSGLDVYDVVVVKMTADTKTDNNNKVLFRTIFHSSNNSCTTSQDDDHFQIPLNTCVGPFGKPRPWGIFTLDE